MNVALSVVQTMAIISPGVQELYKPTNMLDQIKAIESAIDELPNHGMAFNGTGLISRVEAKNLFHESIVALLEADIVRLKGLYRYTRDMESTYRNRFIDSEIAHRQSLIKALKEMA